MKNAIRNTQYAILITLILAWLILPQLAQAAAPVAYDQTVTVAEDGWVEFTLNASDIDGDALHYIIVEPQFYAEFFRRLDSNGNNTSDDHCNRFYYEPIPNYHGSDFLLFKVNDGSADSNVARVDFEITAVNDPAVMQLRNIAFVATPEEGTVTKTFPLNVFHPDQEALTFTAVNLSANASLNPQTGILSWVINSADAGDYPNVTFRVSDGITTVSQTITLRVRNTRSTYYVDVNNPSANDTGPGTQNAPFKTIQRGVNALLPGDTLYVRAGRYQEDVDFLSNWTGDYITVQAYPGEQPLIDGSFDLTGWNKCTQATCNAAAWEKIWYVDVPPEVTVFSANLYMGEEQMLQIAQDPDPLIPLDYEMPTTWRLIPSQGYTNTQIIDPAVFTQDDPHYWDGAYVMVWSGNNNIFTRLIKEYIPAEHKITFDQTCDMQWVAPGEDKYSLWNHLPLLSHNGEYYVDPQNHRIYLYYDSATPLENVTVSLLEYGFAINSRSYIIIDGFKFRRQTCQETGYHSGVAVKSTTGARADHVIFRNNEVTQNSIWAGRAVYMSGCDDCVVDNNYIHDTPARGIAVIGVSSRPIRNTVVSNNRLERVWGTGITFFWADHCAMINNTNINSNGQHANGLTAYLWSHDVDIIGNTIINCNNALTMNEIWNVNIKDNVFATGPSLGYPGVLVCWNGKARNMVIDHNTCLDSPGHNSIAVPTYGKNIVVTNNIADGITVPSYSGADYVLLNNLLTGLSAGRTLEQMGAGAKLEPDVNSIFVDYVNYDYRLQPDSIACYMSTEGSYVGAYPPVGCEGNIPIAMFKVDKLQTYEHEAVSFDASDSLSCAAAIISYAWDFGDDTSATGVTTTHAFQAGLYNVILTITNEAGQIDTSTKTIKVLPSAVPGLQLYLNCDENVLDFSGKDNHGQWVGIASYVSGKAGLAVSMNGTPDGSYVFIDNSNTLDGFANGLTLAVWVRKNSSATGGNVLLKHAAYNFNVGTSFSGYLFNKLGTRLNYSVQPTGMQDTAWHHYALTYEGSRVQLFIDGSAVGNPYTFSGEITVTTHDFYLGKNPWGNSFNGDIDEVCIYSRGLSPTEIHDLYTNGPFSQEVMYGDVNQDAEITAFDAALAAHIAVGLEHPDIKNRAAAEVSGDGEVGAYDAALIAQRAVGLIEKFPVE